MSLPHRPLGASGVQVSALSLGSWKTFERLPRERGLAVMTAESGSIIAYSTAPGSVASDGEGRNGLYTQELLANIRKPGLKIEEVLKHVRVAVKEKSNGKQVPWETTALDGDFYFVKQSQKAESGRP